MTWSSRLLAAILAAGLTVGSLVVPVAARGVVPVQEVPHFAANAPQGGLLSPLASQPQAVKYGSKTYITYEGPGLDPYVACWDELTKSWDGPYRVGTNPQTWDTHGGPALFVDTRGNLHVFFGSHHQPLLHARTAEPGEIDTWITMPPILGETTYPKPVHTATGPMLFYRSRNDVANADMDWVYRESTDDGDTWSPPVGFMHMEYPLSVYPMVAERADGSLDVTWVDIDWGQYFATRTRSRFNIYYAHRTADGTWENAFGEQLTLPLDAVTAQKCLAVDSGSEYTNQPVPGIDPQGRACVMFLQGTENPDPVYRYRFARAEEGTWTVNDIAEGDHFFDSCVWHNDGQEMVAFLMEGGTGPDGATRNKDSGGRIARWTSSDGETWTRRQQVDPGAPGTLLDGFNFHGLQRVLGDDATSRVVFQESNLVSSPAAQGLYLWGEQGVVKREVTASVTRIGEQNRYAQAAAVAQQSFSTGTRTIVIASGEQFADALVAGPLAALNNAPILLVQRDTLPSTTRTAIRALHAQDAIIIGGANAVSASIETGLRNTGIGTIDRIGGRTRYETASLVAQPVAAASGSKRAFIASGEVFADGVAAGAAAALAGDPILLVASSGVPTATVEALGAIRPQERIVVGGPLRIPATVYAQAGATLRIGGRDRYDVAAAMARWAKTHGALPYRTMVTTGADFPDCLSASVIASRLKAAIVLTPRSYLATGPADVLLDGRHNTVDVFVYGGPLSVSDGTFEQVRTTVQQP